MKLIHYQSSTALYKTICGLEKQYEKGQTSPHLEDVTCSNCTRAKVFKARKNLTELEKKSKQETEKLKLCPLSCGGKAKMVRKGTANSSCIVECEDCGLRLETGEVWDSGRAWNRRPK